MYRTTYTTLTAAVAAYNASCLIRAVLFSLTDANYPSETFQITINANTSANATNTLTIKPTQASTTIIVSVVHLSSFSAVGIGVSAATSGDYTHCQ